MTEIFTAKTIEEAKALAAKKLLHLHRLLPQSQHLSRRLRLLLLRHRLLLLKRLKSLLRQLLRSRTTMRTTHSTNSPSSRTSLLSNPR